MITLALIVALTAAGEPVVAPAWTPELALEYKDIESTAISSDGRLVAYTVSYPVTEGEKSETIDRIWVAAADGSSDVAYTRHDVSSTAPAFSPDSRRLAFLSKRGETTQVWTMRIDGGEAEPLTEAENDVDAFGWSPDGLTIAYTMKDAETDEEKQEKEEKREVILVNQNFKYSHLYLVSTEASAGGVDPERESRRLTEGEFHVTEFDWSPDSTSIVFAHRRDPRLDTQMIDGDLSIVQIESGEVTPLVHWGGVDGDPLFSPDGSQIAFRSDGEEAKPVGFGDVYVIDVAGEAGSQRRLALTHDRDGNLLGWSAEGREILLQETRGTTEQILAVPVDGGEARYLSDLPGMLSNASFSGDGTRVAFVHETSDAPPEVYAASVSDFRATQLSSIHEAVERPAMGSTELLSWTSPDGLAIEGLLTYPVGYEKGRRVPLVLQIHGGPAGVHQQSFTGSSTIYPTQVFAQEGYAVLRPNPRGSQGYGKEFRFANVRDWGHGDYEDLISGVDHVIELGVADPDQLYVMGWSYGGYMTSYLVTRTGRFRAASMGAGLSNLVSMVHTTDIAEYLVAHMDRELWEDYEVYERLSAIYWVANVTTPTQVIHGAEDLRVPFTQGQEFFRALERRGVPTEMVVYPRTQHGPEEPKYLMDVPRRILAWFEKHSVGGSDGSESP